LDHPAHGKEDQNGQIARSAVFIIFCFLALGISDTALARALKGTVKNGTYTAPGNQFSFPVPSNAIVEDRVKVIPVSHFYERAFYPVPSSVEIPRRTQWLTVSFLDSRGLSNEIHSMPITGDSFAPVLPALHRGMARRFLQDMALPEWQSSVSRDSWLADNIEYLKLDGREALMATLLVPGATIKGVAWKPEEARLHLHFGVLVFIKDNHVYMLIQSAANYRLPRPEFVDSKTSLQEFHRSITFNTDSALAAASSGPTNVTSR
jgi:hypothetical protein